MVQRRLKPTHLDHLDGHRLAAAVVAPAVHLAAKALAHLVGDRKRVVLDRLALRSGSRLRRCRWLDLRAQLRRRVVHR